MPAEFQGDWVAVSAACTAPARVRIAAASITLVNAADKESLGAVEMAGRGVALADMAMPGADRPGNAALNALNARLRKPNLAKRFPLHQVPLKKCPASK